MRKILVIISFVISAILWAVGIIFSIINTEPLLSIGIYLIEYAFVPPIMIIMLVWLFIRWNKVLAIMIFYLLVWGCLLIPLFMISNVPQWVLVLCGVPAAVCVTVLGTIGIVKKDELD